MPFIKKFKNKLKFLFVIHPVYCCLESSMRTSIWADQPHQIQNRTIAHNMTSKIIPESQENTSCSSNLEQYLTILM